MDGLMAINTNPKALLQVSITPRNFNAVIAFHNRPKENRNLYILLYQRW
jgi:hypothetical protein